MDSIEELIQGYRARDGACECLFCGEKYLRGDIYAFGERLVDAPTAAGLHLEEEHGGAFEALLLHGKAAGKKATGLTEQQIELLRCFRLGLPDKDIAEKTGTTAATVRFQRFHLKEKARQARAFLALFELAQIKKDETKIHPGATMLDERWMATEEEAKKIVATFFASTEPLKLKSLPAKEKKKLVLLRVIAGEFLPGREYLEPEVNGILREIHEDCATLRRYLIEYGFLERTQDCMRYKVKGSRTQIE